MRTLRTFVMTLVALAAQTGLAHTELSGTVPADRATIAAAPEKVELSFSEPVRLTALTIQKGEAAKQSLGPLPAENSETFSVALPMDLGEGHFVVTWRAMSEDTHVMSGEFMFSVGTSPGADVHAGHSPAAAPAQPAASAPATHDEQGGAH